MRLFTNFTQWSAKLMLNLAQIPGLGFLQNYVETARGMKYRFGDHAEDYEVYLMAGQDVMGDLGVGGGKGKRGSKSPSAEGGEEGNVYDDYEFDENDSSRGNFQLDDYPVSDDRHSYYDDDYRAR